MIHRKKILIEHLARALHARLNGLSVRERSNPLLENIVDSILNNLIVEAGGKRTRTRFIVAPEASGEPIRLDSSGRPIQGGEDIRSVIKRQQQKAQGASSAGDYRRQSKQGDTEIRIQSTRRLPGREVEISPTSGELIPDTEKYHQQKVYKSAITKAMYEYVYNELTSPNLSEEDFWTIVDGAFNGRYLTKKGKFDVLFDAVQERLQTRREELLADDENRLKKDLETQAEKRVLQKRDIREASGTSLLYQAISGCLGKNINTIMKFQAGDADALFDKSRSSAVGQVTQCSDPGIMAMFLKSDFPTKFAKLTDKMYTGGMVLASDVKGLFEKTSSVVRKFK